MSGPPPTRRLLLIALCGVVLIALVYKQVGAHPFILFDDDQYVFRNPRVLGGLSWEGVAWAFRSTAVQNWHPLTWLSHMMDVQVFGLDPGAHHLVSVVLHTVVAGLLWIALAGLTGAAYRSALVALLFALHPLHVESVAWVSERKDVLYAGFWMAGLIAYGRYVRRPSLAWYLAVVGLFVLSLLSKPMAVTFPFVLLLLDYWPLGRLAGAATGPASPRRASAETVWSLVREKLPLMALSAASGAVTVVAQARGGAVARVEALPIADRFGNAAVAYLAYARDAIWPAGLAVYYPFATPPTWLAALSALLVVGVTVLSLHGARRAPWLAVGWLWYVGTLVPVIGIVQVGGQARADRYTYVPLVGLFLIVAWGIPAIADRLAPRRKGWVLPGIAAVVVAGLSLQTWKQVNLWRSTRSLFEHALAVTSDNWMAWTNLGKVAMEERNLDEAVWRFQEANRIRPGLAVTDANLGAALAKRGELARAEVLLREAVRIDPAYGNAWLNLGILLRETGRTREAYRSFQRAASLDPGDPWPPFHAGLCLLELREMAGAERELRRSLSAWPGGVEAHTALAVVLRETGRPAEALDHFRTASQLAPADPDVRANLETALREARPR